MKARFGYSENSIGNDKVCDRLSTPVKERRQNPKLNKLSKPKAYCKRVCGITRLVALLLITVLASAVLFSCSDNTIKRNSVLYLKDSQIYYMDFDKNDDIWQVTDEFNHNAEDDELILLADVFSLYTFISEDGKYVFFPDRLDYDDDGFSIYYREIDNNDEEAVKVDKNIIFYTVNKDSTVVTYTRDAEQNLYQFDMEKKMSRKIASNVESVKVSDDAQSLVYLDDGENLYAKYGDENPEKISADVSSVCKVSEDFSTVYYIKNDSIYKYVKDGVNERIVEDVFSVLEIYETGEIYYLSSHYLIDYVNDNVTGTNISDSRREQYERIIAKLTEEKAEDGPYILNYYDGKTSTVITKEFKECFEVKSDEAYIAYSTFIMSDFEKLKLSNVIGTYNVKNHLESYFSNNEEHKAYFAYKGTETLIEAQRQIKHMMINDSLTSLYYTDNVNDDLSGQLYRMPLENGTLGEATRLDSNVYTHQISFFEDERIYYFKSVKDNHADLYIDGNFIDSDVLISNVGSYFDLGDVFYFTDCDFEKNTGRVKKYDGEEITVIADDVMRYVVSPTGKVFYLKNYNTKRNSGDLCEWYEGSSRIIQNDVSYIFPYETHKVTKEMFR